MFLSRRKWNPDSASTFKKTYIWKTGFRLIFKFEGKPWIPEQEIFDLIVKNGPLLSHTFVGFCLTLAVEMPRNAMVK